MEKGYILQICLTIVGIMVGQIVTGKIWPKVGEKFTSVVSLIYYNQNGFKRVYDHKKDPEKNEINFALVDGRTKTILEDILIKKIL